MQRMPLRQAVSLSATPPSLPHVHSSLNVKWPTVGWSPVSSCTSVQLTEVENENDILLFLTVECTQMCPHITVEKKSISTAEGCMMSIWVYEGRISEWISQVNASLIECSSIHCGRSADCLLVDKHSVMPCFCYTFVILVVSIKHSVIPCFCQTSGQ